MTPRAFASETMPLLKPLSCQAIAAASDGETPYCEATACTSPALRRAGVGSGAAAGTTCVAGAGSEERVGAGAPAGGFGNPPAGRTPGGVGAVKAAQAAPGTPAPGGAAGHAAPP